MLKFFVKYLRTITIIKYGSGNYVDGEWKSGTQQNQNVKMIAMPITPSQLRNLPEGAYQAGDMRFYAKGGALYNPGDIFVVDGIRYIVRDIMNRQFDGNFTVYYAKRDYDNA